MPEYMQQSGQAERTAGATSKGAVIVTADGKTIPLDGVSTETLQALGVPIYGRTLERESDGPYVVGSLAIFATAAVFITGLVLRHRGKMRGVTAKSAMSPELSERMARIEIAVESVAVEVERISEGQRFTTRLLSERPVEEVRRG